MRKDLATKQCLSDNKHYADLIKGGVFGGRQLLKPQGLADRDSHAIMRLGRTAGKISMCMALEDMRTKNREEGREEGISALAEAYQEFQVSRDETIVKLCEKSTFL